MATRTKPDETASNGALPVTRGEAVHGMPKRNAGRKRSDYTAWQSEVDNARENLGLAFPYHNCPNVGSIAQGLKREFGVDARTQNVDKDTGTGTLWLAWPATDNGDGTFTEDPERVQAILDKFVKSD